MSDLLYLGIIEPTTFRFDEAQPKPPTKSASIRQVHRKQSHRIRKRMRDLKLQRIQAWRMKQILYLNQKQVLTPEEERKRDLLRLQFFVAIGMIEVVEGSEEEEDEKED